MSEKQPLIPKRIQKRPRSRKTSLTKREGLERELEEVLSFVILAKSDEGMRLIEVLLGQFTLALDTMLSQTLDLTHTQFIDLAIRMRERLEIVRQLVGADLDVDFLKEALKMESEREKLEKMSDNVPIDNGMTDHSKTTP